MGYRIGDGKRLHIRPPKPPVPRQEEGRIPADVLRGRSTAQARSATARAFQESGAGGQAMLRRKGVTTEPAISTAGPSPHEAAYAWASVPKIGWRVEKSGKLATHSAVGTARHEVAHHLMDLPTETEHRIITKLRTEEVGGYRLAATRPLSRMSPERRGLTVEKFARAGQVSGVGPATMRGPKAGFQTPHLTKVATKGTPSQARRARELMRRLGRRMKARGVDF